MSTYKVDYIRQGKKGELWFHGCKSFSDAIIRSYEIIEKGFEVLSLTLDEGGY